MHLLRHYLLCAMNKPSTINSLTNQKKANQLLQQIKKHKYGKLHIKSNSAHMYSLYALELIWTPYTVLELNEVFYEGNAHHKTLC